MTQEKLKELNELSSRIESLKASRAMWESSDAINSIELYNTEHHKVLKPNWFFINFEELKARALKEINQRIIEAENRFLSM